MLLKIGSILGVTPPNKYSKWNITYHYYYSLFIFFMVLASSIYSIYFNTNNYKRLGKPEMFVDILTSISLLLQGSAIALSYLTQPKKWYNFINKLERNHCKNNNKTAIAITGIIHLLLVMRITFSWIVWFPMTQIEISKYYIFRIVHKYYGTFSACFIIHINNILRQRFLSIHETLERFKFKYIRIRQIQKLYRELMEIIEDFNPIFGYQIVFILGNTIAALLENFQNAFLRKNIETQRKGMVSAWSLLHSFAITVRIAIYNYFNKII